MKRLAAAVVLAGVLPGAALAQFRPFSPPGGYNPGAPTISPYLNLARGGNPAINYYGIVRPQQYMQSAIQGLQQGEQYQGPGTDPATGEPELRTGHRVYFNYLGPYYAGLNGQGTGGGGTGRFGGAAGGGLRPGVAAAFGSGAGTGTGGGYGGGTRTPSTGRTR